MTELQKKRYDIVSDILKKYGLKINGKIIISYYDMAWLINNRWDARHFITDKSDVKVTHTMKENYAVDGFYLNHLFNAITHAVKNTEIEAIKGGFMRSYLVMKNE